MSAETDNSVIKCCPDCEYGQRTVKDDSIDAGWRFEDCDTCRGGGYVWKIKPLPARCAIPETLET